MIGIRKIINWILIMAILTGCKNSLKDRLISKIDEDCGIKHSSGCKIILKNCIKFKWDKMYIFGNWTTSDTIAKVIGFKYDGNDVPDQYWRMLFTSGKKIIYEEDMESLDYYNPSIEFEGMDDNLSKNKPFYLTSDNAIFTVDKSKIENSCKKCYVYELRVVGK